MSFNRKSLESFFRDNHKVAVACSGGTDSTFLVHTAVKMGADILPIIVRSQFECHGEVDDAVAFCRSEGVEPMVIDVDMLTSEDLLANGPDRCYICKRIIFGAILEAAGSKGYTVVADGTNASDDREDRPGMRALEELGIRSPMRDAGLTKSQIRRMSRSERLSTWNKTSNSCLATRVRTGVTITGDILERVGGSEDALKRMGFSGFRVNTDGVDACVRFPASMRSEAVRREAEIVETLSEWFPTVTIDEVTRDG